jgi:hypothetical protein
MGDAAAKIAALEAELATELSCSSDAYEEGEERRSRIGSALAVTCSFLNNF